MKQTIEFAVGLVVLFVIYFAIVQFVLWLGDITGLGAY